MKFTKEIKNFKNHADAMAFRNGMLDEAQALVDEGDMDAYNARMEDVRTFDAEYGAHAEAQANIAAERGNVSMVNVLSEQGRQEVVSSMRASMDQNDRGYRMAFMNFVLKGEAIPAEFRNEDQYTTTSDVTAVIPNTILDRIVEKMEKTGTILNKVTRTFYKGGVSVPTSAAKPVATWTTERGTADKQKKGVTSITFAYHKLKCVVAVSLTVENVTLEVFERTLANNIAEAMVKALESAIVSGTGNGQPKGVLKETAPEGQNVDIAAGKDVTYKDLAKAEGLLPAAYESAEWYMPKKTYFEAIVGMVDQQGQPIARTTVGIDGKPNYHILGRPVNFVSVEDMPEYATAANAVFAFIFKMEDYMLNTNMGVTVTHYDDHDTDDKMTKAIMLADGKVIDKNSLVTLTKKA